MSATSKRDLPIKSFKSADAFEKWLAKNHSTWRLNTPHRPAIRENRMKKLLQMLAARKKLH
jgi:hypothetical protein